MIGDAHQPVGEPGLRIDVVRLRGRNGVEAVDGALNLEQRVDALDRRKRDRRQDERNLALRLAPGRGLDVGKDEEPASGVRPTCCLSDRSGRGPGP